MGACQAFLGDDSGSAPPSGSADAATTDGAIGGGDAPYPGETGTVGDGGPVVTPDAAIGCSPALLICDTFARADQSGWGVATSGATWEGDATGGSAFSIFDGRGLILAGPTNVAALIGGTMADSSVYVVGRQSGALWFGAILRATSTNNYYFGGFGNSSIIIERNLAGLRTAFQGLGPSPVPDVEYAIRFAAVGTSLMLKVWRRTDTEPTAWSQTLDDGNLTEGRAGVLAAGDNQVDILRFEASSP
jgi:hypothetical protein